MSPRTRQAPRSIIAVAAILAFALAENGCAPGGSGGHRRSPEGGGGAPLYWSRTFGTEGLDQARAVVESSRGGFLLVGDSDAPGDRSGEVWAVRVDGAGQAIWSHHYGENGLLLDEVRAIDSARDGDCFVAGPSHASPSGGAVARVTPDLRVRWRSPVGFAGVQGVRALPDGGCIVVGSTFDPDTGAISVAKLDAEGRVEWQGTFGAGCGYAAREDGSGGFYVGGCRVIDDDEQGPIVLSLRSDGSIRWTESSEEPGSGRMAVRALRPGPGAGLIAIGSWLRGPDPDDASTVFRQLISSSGELLDHDTFSRPGGARWRSIDVLPSGEYVVAGTAEGPGAGESHPVAGRYSADLDELSITDIQPAGFSGFASGDDVEARPDGSYVLRGTRTSFTNDVFVTQLFPDGSPDRIGISSIVSTGSGPATGDDRALASVFVTGGGFLIGGRTSQGPNGDGAWLSLLDENLQESIETIHRTRTEDHAAAAVESIGGDGFVIAGWTTVADFALPDTAHLSVFEIDGDGELRWRRALRREDGGAIPSRAVALARTNDGYAVLAKAGRSLVLTRLGPGGEVEGSRILTESSVDALGASIKALPDGGFVLAGTILFDDGDVAGRVWVSRLGPDLTEAWRQEVSVPLPEEGNAFSYPARAVDIAVAGDGYAVLCTLTVSDFPAPLDRLWAFKLDLEGGVAWSAAYSEGDPVGSDRAAAIAVDSSGDLLVAATTTRLGGGQPCGQLTCANQLLLRLDAAGQVRWQRTYSTALEDHASAIAPTSDGGIILLGETNGVGETQDLWAIKMTAEGEVSTACPGGIGEPSSTTRSNARTRLDGIAFGAGEIELQEAFSDPDSFAVGTFTQTEQCIDVGEAPGGERRTFTLTVEVRGDGKVTSRDGVVNCTERCTYEVEEGAEVRLAASPAASSAFDAWGGDTDDGVVVMDRDRTVRARFQPIWDCDGGSQAFEEGDWPESWADTSDPAGSEVASYRRPEGGNPRALRNQYTYLAAGGRSVVGQFDPRFTWDPARDGAIDRLDFHAEASVTDFLPAGWRISVCPALLQGGRLYVAAGGAVTAERWIAVDRAGLRSADFPEVDGRRPDFSAAGEPIQLGYASEVTNSSAAATSVQHGVDNWRGVVHAECR